MTKLIFGSFLNAAGPTFTDWPKDQTAFEDATVEMGCSADGYPSPALVWTKNGAPLLPDDRTAIGLTRIRIERVRVSDQGRYRCTVSNPVATLEAEAVLTVVPVPRSNTIANASPRASSSRRAPFFIRTPESVEVFSGSTVTLACQADGNPTPDIIWRKDGVEIPLPDSSDSDSLTLRNIGTPEAGAYECVAANDFGIIVSRAVVAVKGIEKNALLAAYCYDSNIRYAQNDTQSATVWFCLLWKRPDALWIGPLTRRLPCCFHATVHHD